LTEYVEDYIQLPPDGTGKKVRAIKRPDNRYEEVTIPLSLNGEVDLKTLLDKLASRLPRKIEADDGTGVYAEIHRTNNALQTYVKNFPASYPLPNTQVSDLKKVTVENILRRIEADDGTGVYKEIHRRNNALMVSLEKDQIGLVGSVNNRLSKYYVSKRCISKSGYGVTVRAEDVDPVIWFDSTEYPVTETSPTVKTYFLFDTNVLKVGVLALSVKAKVLTEGDVLHVLAENRLGQVLFEDTWTKTEFEDKTYNVTNAYFEPPRFPERIGFKAWVEAVGQQGVINLVGATLDVHGTFNLAYGWTGLVGQGHGVKPLLIDNDGRLRIKVEPITRDYKDFDVTATAEATTEVIPAPPTGQKIRLFDVHFACDSDIITALRFGATGNLMWALPTKGAISKNLINRERDAPEATGLYVYTSNAGRVIGTIGYEIVPA